VSRKLERKDTSRAAGGRRSLLRLLVEGSRALEGRLHEGLRVRGYADIRPAHYAVFRYLKGEGSRVTELAEAAGMTKQSMGELVAHLEKRGYVRRRPDPRDGRARIVYPTEAGRRGIEAAGGRLAEIEDDLRGRMGEDGLERLAGLLAELTALLEEPDTARPATSGHDTDPTGPLGGHVRERAE
jgi:MarR family transcriptional regulator, temperature-dependent positive regulator of motility